MPRHQPGDVEVSPSYVTADEHNQQQQQSATPPYTLQRKNATIQIQLTLP
jgi:hypothetical protein